MKANDVYRETIKFVWMKLALGACAILFSVVLGLLLLGISALSQNEGVITLSLMLWIGASAGGRGRYAILHRLSAEGGTYSGGYPSGEDRKPAGRPVCIW